MPVTNKPGVTFRRRNPPGRPTGSGDWSAAGSTPLGGLCHDSGVPKIQFRERKQGRSSWIITLGGCDEMYERRWTSGGTGGELFSTHPGSSAFRRGSLGLTIRGALPLGFHSETSQERPWSADKFHISPRTLVVIAARLVFESPLTRQPWMLPNGALFNPSSMPALPSPAETLISHPCFLVAILIRPSLGFKSSE